MGMSKTATTPASGAAGGFRLGERVRALRVSSGLTQTQLAGERFSKEYISQIERGKTRPTAATVEWLAERLGVDPVFLASGVSTEERTKAEALLARAEALSESHHYEEAIEAFDEARPSVTGTGSPALELRALTGKAWALGQDGDLRPSLELLQRARELVERPDFSDVDRADVLYRLGVCRWQLSSIATAISLFDEALLLAERSGFPCDLLRADILQYRSRCHRRHRDYVAARGRRARAGARRGPGRPARDREHVLPGFAHRPKAGPLRALAQLCAAREGAVPGAERRA